MAKTPQLRAFVQGTIRAEKARMNLTFADLSTVLKAHGIDQSASNLSTKLSRGSMSAQLFLAILKVLGKRSIDLGELDLPKLKQKAVKKKRTPAK